MIDKFLSVLMLLLFCVFAVAQSVPNTILYTGSVFQPQNTFYNWGVYDLSGGLYNSPTLGYYSASMIVTNVITASTPTLVCFMLAFVNSGGYGAPSFNDDCSMNSPGYGNQIACSLSVYAGPTSNTAATCVGQVYIPDGYLSIVFSKTGGTTGNVLFIMTGKIDFQQPIVFPSVFNVTVVNTQLAVSVNNIPDVFIANKTLNTNVLNTDLNINIDQIGGVSVLATSLPVVVNNFPDVANVNLASLNGVPLTNSLPVNLAYLSGNPVTVDPILNGSLTTISYQYPRNFFNNTNNVTDFGFGGTPPNGVVQSPYIIDLDLPGMYAANCRMYYSRQSGVLGACSSGIQVTFIPNNNTATSTRNFLFSIDFDTATNSPTNDNLPPQYCKINGQVGNSFNTILQFNFDPSSSDYIVETQMVEPAQNLYIFQFVCALNYDYGQSSNYLWAMDVTFKVIDITQAPNVYVNNAVNVNIMNITNNMSLPVTNPAFVEIAVDTGVLPAVLAGITAISAAAAIANKIEMASLTTQQLADVMANKTFVPNVNITNAQISTVDSPSYAATYAGGPPVMFYYPLSDSMLIDDSVDCLKCALRKKRILPPDKDRFVKL